MQGEAPRSSHQRWNNQQKALQDLSRDEEWLKNALKREGVESVDDVFLCIYQNNGMFVIKKEMNSKDTFF